MDRSIIENIMMAACAGVFWDEFGNWIYGFVRNLGMLSQLNFGASFQPYRLHGIRGFGI